MTTMQTYPVLMKAREIANTDQLTTLAVRKYLGVPLADDIRRWMAEQPPLHLLHIDYAGIHAVTTSVAEELGPLLMQAVQQNPTLEHRYPIFSLNSPEPAYTFARAFADFNITCPAFVEDPAELDSSVSVIAAVDGHTVVTLGQLSTQMTQILTLADQRAQDGQELTSDDLAQLDFLATVGPAARSKRLTELYARRLLAFRENPRNPKERLFTPPWRL